MSKIQQSEQLDARPSKRLYRSIIADYDLKTALAELIDNVIDSAKREKLQRTATVRVGLDFDGQWIEISDDAGGIAEDKLTKLIKPGASYNDGSDSSIGIFGVGSKRAAVALAADIKIKTRYKNASSSFLVEYDEDWLGDEDNWDLPYYKISDIAKSSTVISLSKLRIRLEEPDEPMLIKHFGKLYANFIQNGAIALFVNGKEVAPLFFNQWSYPEGFFPHSFERRLKPPGKSLPVLVKVTSGLTWEPGSISRYGVYFYCNGRLILEAAKLPEFGFVSGLAGIPHPRMSNSRVIVEMTGSAADMPWTSNKTGIHFNHPLFRIIGSDIQTSVKNATALSKKLQSDYSTAIEPFKVGTPVLQKLRPDEPIKASKLPPIPRPEKQTRESFKDANKAIIKSKPWAQGPLESILASRLVREKSGLDTRNRISLVILDSCLEIAFKDYLVNEVPASIAEARLQGFSRINLEAEVRTHIFTSNTKVWRQVQYFYKLRCDLTHKRSGSVVSEHQLDIYERLVFRFLRKMFGMKFPAGG